MNNRVLATVFILLLCLFAIGIFHFNRDGNERKPKKVVRIALLDGGVQPAIGLPVDVYLDFTTNKNVTHSIGAGRTHANTMARLIYEQTRKQQGKAPHILLYSLKVLDDNGYGKPMDMVRAIEWCKLNRVDVVNISAGFHKDQPHLKEAIQDARNNGLVLVAAAGNTYGLFTYYPAAYAEVLSVGALDETGGTARYSATDKIDIRAPGFYGDQRGTSVAAAYTSAFIAKNFTDENQLEQMTKHVQRLINKEMKKT